jgi:hypothetical protein
MELTKHQLYDILPGSTVTYYTVTVQCFDKMLDKFFPWWEDSGGLIANEDLYERDYFIVYSGQVLSEYSENNIRQQNCYNAQALITYLVMYRNFPSYNYLISIAK